MKKVQVNSIVQIKEYGDEDWIGCLVQVYEVKGWGVKGTIKIPNGGLIAIRLSWEQFDYVGEGNTF